jgi:hypothetical protein
MAGTPADQSRRRSAHHGGFTVAKARRPAEPVIEPKIFTSLEEVNQALVKLGRRLDEVRKLDLSRTPPNDPGIQSAAHNFCDTVQHHRIWYGPMGFNMPLRFASASRTA